jgi:hypothetical protein
MAGAPQDIGVDQVIGVDTDTPLDLLLAVASSLLDPLSAATSMHQFVVRGVLGAKRRIGVRLK